MVYHYHEPTGSEIESAVSMLCDPASRRIFENLCSGSRTRAYLIEHSDDGAATSSALDRLVSCGALRERNGLILRSALVDLMLTTYDQWDDRGGPDHEGLMLSGCFWEPFLRGFPSTGIGCLLAILAAGTGPTDWDDIDERKDCIGDRDPIPCDRPGCYHTEDGPDGGSMLVLEDRALRIREHLLRAAMLLSDDSYDDTDEEYALRASRFASVIGQVNARHI